MNYHYASVTSISSIIVFIIFFSVVFCIGFFGHKNNRMTLKEYIHGKKQIIVAFVIFLFIFTTYLFFRYMCRMHQYVSIYEHSIKNVNATISKYDKMSIKLILQNNQEYIFTPQNMIPSDFEKYTTNWGYLIEKKAASDTIYLIKEDTVRICLIQKP